MKFTVATIAALAVAVAAKPAFLNTAFDVEQGEPFTLKYSGCDSGCTITLLNGDSKDLNDYKVLTAEATGDSFTFTPSGLPTDTYAFKITDNDSGEYNYSSQFEYAGTGAATTAAATTTALTVKDVSSTVESTTAESTVESTSTTKKATTLTKVTTTTAAETPISTPAQNSTTPASSKSTSTKGSSTEGASSTSAEATSSVTTVPDSGAARLSSSIALIAGAVMAMVYLN